MESDGAKEDEFMEGGLGRTKRGEERRVEGKDVRREGELNTENKYEDGKGREEMRYEY